MRHLWFTRNPKVYTQFPVSWVVCLTCSDIWGIVIHWKYIHKYNTVIAYSIYYLNLIILFQDLVHSPYILCPYILALYIWITYIFYISISFFYLILCSVYFLHTVIFYQFTLYTSFCQSNHGYYRFDGTHYYFTKMWWLFVKTYFEDFNFCDHI